LPDFEPDTSTVTLASHETLSSLALRFNVSIDALLRANPQLMGNRRITYAMPVVVPLPEPKTCPHGRLEAVQPGDTLFVIAERHGLPAEVLIRANPQVGNPNNVYVGQLLCVPFPVPSPCEGGSLVALGAGETLQALAGRYGICLDDLLAANPQIKNRDFAGEGMLVCVPPPPPPPSPAPPPVCCKDGAVVRVPENTTLEQLAGICGSSALAIRESNPQLAESAEPVPGQYLCVPFPPAPQCPGGSLVALRAGESLADVAKRVGMSLEGLLDANPQVKDIEFVGEGMLVCIPVAGSDPLKLPDQTVEEPVPVPGATLIMVRRGETLLSIAKSLGVSIQQVLALNPHLREAIVVPGQGICVPAEQARGLAQ